VLHEHIHEIFNLWGHLGISPAKPSANPAADHSDIDPVVLAHLGFKDVAVTVNGDIKPIGHCDSVKMLPTTSNLEQAKARQLWLDSERQKREELIQTCYDELCVLWTRVSLFLINHIHTHTHTHKQTQTNKAYKIVGDILL
jgi:hypothetical protein